MKNYIYASMELYDQTNGIRGGGGLGVLAADMRRAADEADVALTLLTPFYPWEVHQKLENGQFSDYYVEIFPAEFGYERLGEAVVATAYDASVRLEVWQKVFGSTRILTVFEPDFGELYSDGGSSDHRLYQEVALGFGGWQALRYAEIEPTVLQLNETATFFCALAWLDDLVAGGKEFYAAVDYVRRHTLYTNHTLVQAAESEFTLEQFVRFVLPNLQCRSVQRWLVQQFVDGRAKLSGLTLELSGKRSGVSKLHARVAEYYDLNGDKVEFTPVTNGVDFDWWTEPRTLKMLKNGGVITETGLPGKEYAAKIAETLVSKDIEECKAAGKKQLYEMLEDRYGITGLDEKAVLFNFKRRFVDYKRPWLAFRDTERLARILKENNAYYFLAGRVHTGDDAMLDQLKKILVQVEENDELRSRVFYLADYDEKVAAALSAGCDIAVNNPIVGLEACGTSWEKDISNLQILVSTHDGGVADITPAVYLEIVGEREEDEVESLYQQMERAAKLAADPEARAEHLQQLMMAYLPTMSATRMVVEYLDLLGIKHDK
ncbi:glycogen/starch/alpha-glucan phosphorylase [Candidatus Saccharibacteria bacterium]|nr:glycogen/starch/alpha-glucan phosphorylase [Candidatus Saccharibacteria bacterium]